MFVWVYYLLFCSIATLFVKVGLCKFICYCVVVVYFHYLILYTPCSHLYILISIGGHHDHLLALVISFCFNSIGPCPFPCSWHPRVSLPPLLDLWIGCPLLSLELRRLLGLISLDALSPTIFLNALLVGSLQLLPRARHHHASDDPSQSSAACMLHAQRLAMAGMAMAPHKNEVCPSP